MFLGTHTPKLDDKGRFVLPARFREALADGLIIAKSQERCLAIYTPEDFTQQAQAAMAGSATVRGTRNFQRTFAAGSSEESLDKQGRVTIPPLLRAYAGLDKDIAVIGAFNRIEVWDLAAWTAFEAEQDEAFAALDEAITPGASGG